jgi:5-methyltetrahydrofolate--homocysteine methyltransferase
MKKMISNQFTELLKTKKVLLTDGATGTNLFEQGLESGAAPELWNSDGVQSQVIIDLHLSFLRAGSDIILTNTFGANRSRMKLHGAENQINQINRNAVALAKIASQFYAKDKIRNAIAGSIGPTGEIFEPLGSMSIKEASEIFREQAQGLADGGVDCFWIETMSSEEELKAALAGVRGFDIPVVATVSFDTNGHTMMGISPREFHSFIRAKVHALGANCGTGPEEALKALEEMLSVSSESFDTIVIKANCGIPQFQGSEIVYSGTPTLMAAYAAMAAQMGAKIIGGCCGTTPEHIRAMREALDLWIKVQEKDLPAVTKHPKERRRTFKAID